MWLRAHLSAFALGSVVLLVINLLRGTGGVWADIAIGAWGVLVLAHGIALIIARLLQELASDDDKGEIRPASEMRWPKPASSPSTWSLPLRRQQRPAGASPAAATPSWPVMDLVDTATAAADRDGAGPRRAPQPAPEPAPPTAKSDEGERVSWQAATDAAWLAPRKEPSAKGKPDDEDDFTPLKFD